jgi:hypothetical protein
MLGGGLAFWFSLGGMASGNGIGCQFLLLLMKISTMMFSLGGQLFVEIDFRGVDLRITVRQANEAKYFSVAFVFGVVANRSRFGLLLAVAYWGLL